MGEPLWLDTNSLIRLHRDGDLALANELLEYSDKGYRLMVTLKVYEELTRGNPYKKNGGTVSAAGRQRAKIVMGLLGIELDVQGSMLGTPGPESKINTKDISVSDARILGEIMASAQSRGVRSPKLFTLESGERAMISASKTARFGVTPITRQSKPSSNVGRKNFEYFFPRQSPVDSGGPASAALDSIPLTRRPSVLGNQAAVAMLGTALIGLEAWLCEYGIQRQVERVLATTLSRSMAEIKSRGEGVLVIVNIQRFRPVGDIMLQPSLLSVFVQGGRNYSEALDNWLRPGGIASGPPNWKDWYVETKYGWSDPPSRSSVAIPSASEAPSSEAPPSADSPNAPKPKLPPRKVPVAPLR
jgi:hypothetical protein